MILSKRRFARAVTLLFAVAIVNILIVVCYLGRERTLLSIFNYQNFFRLSITSDSIKDYSIFFKGLEHYNPDIPKLTSNYEKKKAQEVKTENDEFLMSKEYLQSIIDLPQATVAKLEESHSNYIEVHMKNLIELHNIKSFGGIQPHHSEWSKYEGSRGYVMVGGERYSWLALLVIKQVRALGMKYPIELFIPGKNDYEAHFCEVILPSLNARCNLPEESFLEELKSKFNLHRYQFKLIAFLTSRFENILYLDADGFPLVNLDYIFESELYKEKNMLLWPDAWARTTNPAFYDIAGLTVNESKKTVLNAYDKKKAADRAAGKTNETPDSDYSFKNAYFHTFEGALPDPTTEAGIMFINKTSHLKTLLLCLYYNVYGPDTYYSLLTQGAAGEGDKETFIAAATVMGEPYYQTGKGLKFCGYINKETKEFNSKSLGHYDPIETYKSDDPASDDLLKFIFMHLSYPKYYPEWLVNNRELKYEHDGEDKRIYEEAYESAGYDFDLRVFQIFVESLCSSYYDEESGKSIDGLLAVKDTDFVGVHLRWLREHVRFNEKLCKNVFLSHLQYLKESTPEKYKDKIYRKDAE